jgi:hypothetical protein
LPLYILKNEANPKQQRSILFSHIPKTGGTSIAQVFQSMGFQEHYCKNVDIRDFQRVTATHYDYEILDKLFHIEKFSTSFAIVRHPVKRFISDYKWAMSKTDYAANNPQLPSEPNINDWVDFVFNQYEKNPYFMANHVKPQHLFVGPKIQKVYKFEDGLDVAFANVLATCGIKLTSANPMSQGRYNSTSDVVLDTTLTQKSLRRIEAFYAEDFKQFGYETLG